MNLWKMLLIQLKQLQEKISLYLSENEIRKLDREEAVNEGIEQNRMKMIINMYHDNFDLNIIAKYANITVDDVKEIITKSNKNKKNNVKYF